MGWGPSTRCGLRDALAARLYLHKAFWVRFRVHRGLSVRGKWEKVCGEDCKNPTSFAALQQGRKRRWMQQLVPALSPPLSWYRCSLAGLAPFSKQRGPGSGCLQLSACLLAQPGCREWRKAGTFIPPGEGDRQGAKTPRKAGALQPQRSQENIPRSVRASEAERAG